jgi:photosystem II stability/assembly factor-like uncharacterized protein
MPDLLSTTIYLLPVRVRQFTQVGYGRILGRYKVSVAFANYGSSRYHKMKLITLLTLSGITSALPSASPRFSWTLLPISSTERFRGLAPISSSTAYIAGTNATILRTTNGGKVWADVSPKLSVNETLALQFRDIHVFNRYHAVALTIGEGDLSRIYSTHDSGASWKATFTNNDPAAFYDCIAFANGAFRLLETHDAGDSWRLVSDANVPPALAGESAFAASGTCIEAAAGRWYIASGGISQARIYRSSDTKSWNVTSSTLSGSAASGVFSVRFRDAKHGVAVGGDFEHPTATNGTIAAWSKDGGATWQPACTSPGGYRSGAAWMSRKGKGVVVAVGPTGSDVSVDGGKNWKTFSNESFDAVECVKGTCWASGVGRVAKLEGRW